MSTKLTALTELSAPTLDDLVYVVDTPSGTPTSAKQSLTRLGGLLARNAVGGRLTLTSGTPITSADVTGATSVYFTPYSGSLFAGLVSLYDGTRWRLYPFTELTLALGTLTSGRPYDVFLYDNAGTLTLEALAWTSDTARATALATQDGIYIKSGATTRRYLGTFYTTATTTTEDSAVKRLLWNYYNRMPRPMARFETASTWAYGLLVYQQANANAANQLEYVCGVVEDPVRIRVELMAQHSSTTDSYGVAIGEDSTTTPHAACLVSVGLSEVSQVTKFLVAALDTAPASVGRHRYIWLEQASALSATFYGTITATILRRRYGMTGCVYG